MQRSKTHFLMGLIIAGLGTLVSTLAISPATSMAQGISQFMEGKVIKSPRKTAFLPVNREVYLAMPAVLRTRNVPPAQADISHRFPVPAWQGDQSACAAFAVGYAARSYYVAVPDGLNLRQADNVVSPAYIYNTINRQQKGGGDCKMPISISGALDLLKNQGAVPLSAMAYKENDCLAQVTPDALSKHGQRFRINGWQRLDEPMTLAAVKNQIARGNPVIFGVKITKEWDHEDTWNADFFTKRGPFKSTQRDGREHAMVMTGFDDARQAFKFINSWSNEWGEGGFGWIDYKALQALWMEGYVMTMGDAVAAK